MERTFHMLLYRAFHAQRSYLRPHVARLGLGTGQPKLIVYLAVHGPCRQRELAEYFEIDPAAVCRMLDSLEKGGFVVRTEEKTDRRADVVQLTQKGLDASKAWEQCCAELEHKMLQGFSEQEVRQFSQYLARAYHNLRGKTAGGKTQ